LVAGLTNAMLPAWKQCFFNLGEENRMTTLTPESSPSVTELMTSKRVRPVVAERVERGREGNERLAKRSRAA
jgi:hypothetical protein